MHLILNKHRFNYFWVQIVLWPCFRNLSFESASSWFDSASSASSGWTLVSKSFLNPLHIHFLLSCFYLFVFLEIRFVHFWIWLPTKLFAVRSELANSLLRIARTLLSTIHTNFDDVPVSIPSESKKLEVLSVPLSLPNGNQFTSIRFLR